jgi:hypothetical protein
MGGTIHAEGSIPLKTFRLHVADGDGLCPVLLYPREVEIVGKLDDLIPGVVTGDSHVKLAPAQLAVLARAGEAQHNVGNGSFFKAARRVVDINKILAIGATISLGAV